MGEKLCETSLHKRNFRSHVIKYLIVLQGTVGDFVVLCEIHLLSVARNISVSKQVSQRTVAHSFVVVDGGCIFVAKARAESDWRERETHEES